MLRSPLDLEFYGFLTYFEAKKGTESFEAKSFSDERHLRDHFTYNLLEVSG